MRATRESEMKHLSL